MSQHVQDVGTLLVGAAAALGALLYIGKHVRSGWRAGRRAWATVEALGRVVQKELTNNGGGSMKDDVDALVRQVHTLGRVVDGVVDDFAASQDRSVEGWRRLEAVERSAQNVEAALSTFSESQSHLWPAVEAVARATPPLYPDERPDIT